MFFAAVLVSACAEIGFAVAVFKAVNERNLPHGFASFRGNKKPASGSVMSKRRVDKERAKLK
jgi:hypothetical protein